MAQPLPYERDYDFEGFQTSHPSTPLPGDKVNLELDQVAETANQILDRIARLQDDDLALHRKSVGYDQLKDELNGFGFNPPTTWATATVYAAHDTVFYNAGFYRCLVAHTSGTFAADLAAGDWDLVADFTAATTDAQTAATAAEAAQTAAETAETTAVAAKDQAVTSAANAATSASQAATSATAADGSATSAAASASAASASASSASTSASNAATSETNASASAAAAAASAASIDPATLVRKADTDVSGNSWVLDEDDMASNSATKVPTQQSVKAYVDPAKVLYTPARNNAAGDGTTDDRAALAAADAACLALGVSLFIDKNYKVGSDLVIKSPVVSVGGKFTLPSGVKLTLDGGISAGDWQVFVYADRTCRAWVHNTDFEAAWWGVDVYYDEVGLTWRKTDNDVPLQYALDSVAGSNYDADYPHTWEGGTIHVRAGYCFMQAGVTMHGFQTIRGASRSCIFAPDETNWTGATDYLFKMFKETTGAATISIASPAVISSVGHGLSAGDEVFFTTTGALPTGITADTRYYVIAAGLTADQFEISATPGGAAINTSGTQSGTHTWHHGTSQFNTRLENCRIRGNGFSGVTHQVLAWSPQEQSGCYNVHFDSVYYFGLTYQRGYGGAAVFEMDQCELWLSPSCVSTAKLVNIDMDGEFSVGWINFVLKHMTVAGASAPGANEWCGIKSAGRVILNFEGGHHSEDLKYHVLADTDTCLAGGVLEGGPNQGEVISLNTNWNTSGEAFVDAIAKKGGATKLLQDYTAKGYTLYADDPVGSRIIMPPDPNKAIASIAVENGSTAPTVAYSTGRLSAAPTTPLTGTYRFTMDTALSSIGAYRVRVDFEYPNGANYVLTPYITRNGAGTFDVTFRDASGVLQYVDQFQVHLLHAP